MTSANTTKADRPLSPHLLIYRPQMTSMLSILHRATGAVLAIAMVLFTWWLAAAAYGPEAFAFFMEQAGAWYGQIVLFGISFCFAYHALNGIRHLIWDSGRLFNIKCATMAGYVVFWGSGALTVALWALYYQEEIMAWL